ncbi:hypothetical protein DYD21_19540 [Rhodohalobacter sp. SW132]|nr:hypothetical protein DYD21_19540 [Rhodohalobacter sp. SW132]
MNIIKRKFKTLMRILRENAQDFKMQLAIKKHRKSSFTKLAILYPQRVGNVQSSWIYHSENWTKVKSRWKDRQQLKDGRSVTIIDNYEAPGDDVEMDNAGNLNVNVSATGDDKWVYYYLKPEEHIWRNFEWKFYVKRISNFRELQFGFRYRDFYNRYRFRQEKGKIFFDKVLNGQFQNDICSKEFIMELNREYEFKIICFDYYFALLIDGSVYLEIYDFEKSFKEGSIAIILWENNGKIPIQATIRDQQLHELSK